MSQAQLEQFVAEFHHLLAAGSAAAAGSEVLARRAGALREAAQHIALLKPVADAASRLAGATSQEAPSALLDLLLIVQQIHAGLVSHGRVGKLARVAERAPWQTPLPITDVYDVIVGETEEDRAGHLKRVSETAPGDLRLLSYALRALEFGTVDEADVAAAYALPAFGAVLAEELHRGFKVKGGAGDCRKLALVCKIAPSLGAELCQRALRNGSEAVTQEAVTHLPTVLPLAEAIPLLMESLRDSKKVSQQALLTLEKIGDPVVPAAITGARDKEQAVRQGAVFLVGKFAPRTADNLAILRGALRDRSEEVRSRAAVALGSWGKDARAAVADLVDAIKDNDNPVRVHAIEAIRRIGVKTNAVTEALVEVVREPKAEGRLPALETLHSFTLPAVVLVPVLCEVLARDKDPLKRTALEVLRELGPGTSEVAPLLMPIVTGLDDQHAIEAILCLEVLGVKSKAAIDRAAELVQRSGEYEVRRRAIEILGRRGAEAVSVLPVLRMTWQGDWPISLDTLDAVEQMGEAAVPTLTDWLKERKGSVRLYAARALARLGPVAKEAVKALGTVYRGKRSADVKAAALMALARIGPAAKSALPKLARDTADTKVARAWIRGKREEGIDHLLRAVKQDAGLIRWAYAGGFKDLGDRSGEFLDRLQEALGGPHLEVQLAGTMALGQMKEHATPAIPALIEALAARSWRVQKEAAAALGKIGAPRKKVLEALISGTKNRDTAVRDACVLALKRLT